jgi:hypothetical protein
VHKGETYSTPSDFFLGKTYKWSKVLGEAFKGEWKIYRISYKNGEVLKKASDSKMDKGGWVKDIKITVREIIGDAFKKERLALFFVIDHTSNVILLIIANTCMVYIVYQE